MASQAPFRFGVEIELLLGCKKKTYTAWKALAKDLCKKLLKAGIHCHVNEGNEKSAENYAEWSLVQEITIPNQPAKNLWGIELVSPVYPADWYWAGDLHAIFATLYDSGFTIHPSNHCSTHVHISGLPTPLSALELAAVAKAALYFEPAIDALAPRDRRASGTYWCQSSRASPSLRSYGLADCLALLDHAAADPGEARGVVHALNMFPAASTYGRAHGKKHDFVRGKVYKWDFSGMLPGGRGTVEFRQGGGSLDAAAASGWVALVLAFVAAATDGFGFQVLDPEEGGTGEELWGFVGRGMGVLGWGEGDGEELSWVGGLYAAAE
ncbi:uncharacterized protein E0L32_003387 [Thyridium curvatum]|uniref:Uncharacterized protein n=1 Tax=Thyridium curvatum TaxID=1093900 RepID=A0A507B162_9PEZI|nr:uncharacterized protein E0L32_003387 [Thyridium curvatum]TPX16825.1 hypothetical protein E0L32_003387 [Thyridium curvatum]